MQVIQDSKGYLPDVADNSTYVTVLTVPEGYHCKLTYFLCAASGSITVDAKWSDGEDYTFLHSKNMSAGDSVEFGGQVGKFLVLHENDTIDIRCTSGNATFIISYELYPYSASDIIL